MTIISLKELIVVSAIGAVVFLCAKPLAVRFSSERDFTRRRNVWFLLTATAFMSPSFWLFALVATPLLAWAGRKDTNPVAFYLLMLFVIPSIPIEIPAIGVNRLFALDIYRLLSFSVLIPVAWRLRRAPRVAPNRGFWTPDLLLLAFGALQILLFIPYESPTNTLRRTFLFFVDIYVLYFVVSRACTNRRVILEALAAFCLSGALMACIGIFETARHWLLYKDLTRQWGGILLTFVYLREGAVRAEASSGGPLVLGYLLAIAFGFWLYLQSRVKSLPWRISVTAMWLLGLLAAYSRGPWIGAVGIYFIFAALSPRGLPKLFKALAVACLVAAVIGVSPLGQRIIDVLPFMGGSVDSGSLRYREVLAQRSWQLFQQHPLLGDPFVVDKMQDLRQGEGIIDLVSTYVQVGLFDGLVGLMLFLGFILLALSKAYRFAKRMMQSDPDLALLGVSLVACIMGTLIMISACSFILGYEKIFYVLAGLSVAYSQLAPAAAARTVTRPALVRSAPPRSFTYKPHGRFTGRR